LIFDLEKFKPFCYFNYRILLSLFKGRKKFVESFSMKIIPLGDYVLLEPIKQEEKTKSGILLPESAEKERPEQGKVIAVGPGRRDEKGNLIPVSVKPGQKVLFKKYGPDEIKVDDKEYLICKEEDILAIIED
jgi:chaperonin GroES